MCKTNKTSNGSRAENISFLKNKFNVGIADITKNLPSIYWTPKTPTKAGLITNPIYKYFTPQSEIKIGEFIKFCWEFFYFAMLGIKNSLESLSMMLFGIIINRI